MADKEYNQNLVLCISQKGSHRDALTKEMRQAGLETSFVTELTSVTDIIAEMKPGTLLHDWPAIEPSQGIGFQQRLGKISDYAGMLRIVYAPQITPQLMGMASDCGIRRVVSYGTNHSNLILEIKTALSSLKHLSEIQVLIVKAQAEGQYDQGDIDTSVDRAFAQYAHDPMVKLEYANLCCRRGELDKAHTHVNEILAAQPHNVRAMNLLAKVLMKQGKSGEAIGLLEKANIISPFNTDRLLLLGNSFLKAGQTDKAAAFFEEAASLDPGNEEAGKGLGQVKLTEGDINGALDLLRNSASEDEGAGFFNNAAVLATRAGNHDKAIELYEAALQLLRTNKYKPAVYFNMALTYETLGKFEDALKMAKRALKYDEGYGKALRQKARLEQKLTVGGRKSA